jgi:hypothetical protein
MGRKRRATTVLSDFENFVQYQAAITNSLAWLAVLEALKSIRSIPVCGTTIKVTTEGCAMLEIQLPTEALVDLARKNKILLTDVMRKNGLAVDYVHFATASGQTVMAES